jgi:type I restriction enzyme, S subunit
MASQNNKEKVMSDLPIMPPTEWEEVFLEQVADDITVGYVGSMTSEYVDSGVPFLRSKNIEPYGIKWDDMCFINRTFHERLKKSALSPGDVVIVRTGKPGAATIIPESLPESNCSDIVIVKAGCRLDARFLMYYLNSFAVNYINAHLVGAVQQHFNVGSARKLKINLPPLSEQKSIARILGVLDDKIELNQKMNQTLEAMAQAIFKSWFVDFDPVRAKMAGQQPVGMDEATAALFPDSIEDSELGEIPKGWEVKSFDEIIDFLNGGTPKTSIAEYWDGDIPWFSVRDTPSLSDVFVLKTEKRITALGIEKSPTQILPIGTTIITARGTVGKVAFVGIEMAMNQSCFGIKGKSSYPDIFIYYQLRNFASELQQKSHGSVFDTINRETFKSIKLPLPPTKISLTFDNKINSLFTKIKHNLYQIDTLTLLRDTLLPKLMSGELRVPEADRQIVELV